MAPLKDRRLVLGFEGTVNKGQKVARPAPLATFPNRDLIGCARLAPKAQFQVLEACGPKSSAIGSTGISGRTGPRGRRQAARHSGIAKGAGSRKRFTTFSIMRETGFSKPSCGRLPQKVMEPVEKTAPPAGVS